MELILISIIILNKHFHYSTISFFIYMYIYFFKLYKYYPFIITNSFSILGTWYSTILIWDNKLIHNMIIKNNWSYIQYYIGDFILHIIPFLTSITILLDKNNYNQLQKYSNNDIFRHSGLYSCFTNMFWSILNRNSFNLSMTYVIQPYYNWNYIWCTSILIHLMTMHLINSIYS